MRALVIVDLQNDFLPGGSLAVKESDVLIDRINKLQENFDIVVATQDWHPATHKSFASQHKGRSPFDIVVLDDEQKTVQILWPDHCIQGSKGAELHKDLNKNKISAIIRKGMDPNVDSYSGFNDVNNKNPTGLHGFLQEHRVTNIYICGLAADVCVYHTATDALRLGYTTYILEESTKEIDSEKFEEQKKEFIERGGNVCSYLLEW